MQKKSDLIKTWVSKIGRLKTRMLFRLLMDKTDVLSKNSEKTPSFKRFRIEGLCCTMYSKLNEKKMVGTYLIGGVQRLSHHSVIHSSGDKFYERILPLPTK